MTEVLWVVVGILIGASVLGVGVFFYILFSALRAVTAEIHKLNETIAPIFSDEDIMRGLKSFQILNIQAEQVGRKIESLDSTMQTFSRIMLKPAETPYAAAEAGPMVAPAQEAPSGGVYAYSEAESASREENRNSQREKDEKEGPDALF